MYIDMNVYNETNSKDIGVWVVLDNYLTFYNRKGDFLYLPSSVQRPFSYTFLNCSRNRIPSVTSKTKKYADINEVLDYGIKKLLNKGIGYEIYLIVGLYRCIKDNHPYVKCEPVMALIKDQDGVIYIKNTNITEGIPLNNCSEELFEHVAKYTVHEEILPKTTKTDCLLETQLKEKYNVNEIVFRSKCSLKDKDKIYNDLLSYYDKLANVIDPKLFPKLNIAVENIKSAKADYSEKLKQIRLRIDMTDSFYHEFFHHIDFSTPIISDKFGENIVEVLVHKETLKKYKKNIQSFIQELQNLNIKSKNYRINKYKTFEEYYLSKSEVLARFFSDYMKYNYPISETSNQNLSFSVEEIKEMSDIFTVYLEYLQDFHKN